MSRRGFFGTFSLHNYYSAFESAGLQSGDEVFLAEDEHDEHRHEARHGHGEHIAPLRELVLAEKAGDGDGQRALGVIVDDGHGPGEFLPRGEEVKYAHRRDSGTGERQYDAEEHREYAPAVGVRRLVKLAREGYTLIGR